MMTAATVTKAMARTAETAPAIEAAADEVESSASASWLSVVLSSVASVLWVGNSAEKKKDKSTASSTKALTASSAVLCNCIHVTGCQFHIHWCRRRMRLNHVASAIAWYRFLGDCMSLRKRPVGRKVDTLWYAHSLLGRQHPSNMPLYDNCLSRYRLCLFPWNS